MLNRSKRSPFGRLDGKIGKVFIILAISAVILLVKDDVRVKRMHREMINPKASSRGLDGSELGDLNSSTAAIREISSHENEHV